VHEINESHRVNMPITEAVFNIVYKQADVRKEIQKLSELLT
jgi:glycerol-3-phosphate dehydrogenase